MDPARSDRIYERQATVLLDLYGKATITVRSGKPLDTTLSHFYHEHPEFGSRDRRLFSGTVFSFFRWKGWIDCVARTPDAACVFAHLLETTEIHPAILKLAERAGLSTDSLIPLGALAPREKAKELSRYTGTELSLNQLVPDWIIPMLGTDADRLIEAFQAPPPTWLRTQPENRESAMSVLKETGTEPVAHPLIPSACSVTRGINLRALPRAIRHHIEIQDLASQITGLVCDPKPGETWWDACCGSGGKTLHLSALGGSSLSVLATDVRSTILEELNRRLGEKGNHSITTALWDGGTQPPPEGPFDGILLDAPCSGTGTWHRNPDARWRIKPDAVEKLIILQTQLLRTCATRLKSGGKLVYATCSVTRDENELMVERFLADTPGIALAPFINPLQQKSCNGMLRINPWDGSCNGMFIALMKRA